jgi:hypothetical protein
MRKERAGRSCALRAKYIAVAVAAAFAPWSVYGQTPPPPNQMPSVTVARGDAVVNPATGTYQQIDQASLRAIYEGSMTMGSNAHLHLNHAVFGRSGLGLFKDVSGSLSQIFGRITSNGQVFISNPNGVLFGSSARVDVGGLFATTLSTNDDQFMAGGARIQWTNNGATGTVTNQGEIITASGYAALAGPQVRNDGIIRAQTGSVVLAAGDRVNLDLIGDGLISVSVDQAAMNASAINAGTIEADGGKVLLTVRSAGSLLDTVINAGGVIRATSLIEHNGEIVLDGGGAGLVAVTGNHNAGSSSVSGANVTMRGTIVTDLGSGSQTVSTPGTLRIEGVGGSASNSGFIHQGSGEQRVEAGNLLMEGGTGVGVNAVITSSNANADQRITVSGNLQVKGGATGDGNQAIIRSAGNQVIDGNPNITVEGGASSGPGGNNTAFIVGATSNQVGKKQTINAGSITMRSGAGGFQNGAVILGPRQEITTTGDVLLAGGSTGGTLGGVRMGGLSTGAGGVTNTATDLKLIVGNDLLMRGGAVASNSANIGSTTGQAQTVSITAARDVVVNDSITSVSRIGTVASTLPTNGTPGSISVSAGRDLKVNGGGEIVTTGTVTLSAANIAVKVDAGAPAAGGARVQSGAGQDIQAQSVSVIATNGRSAQLINAGTGTQSVKAGTVEVRTVAPIGGLAEIRNNSAGDQTVTVTGDKLDIKAVGGGTATIFGGGNQTIDMTRVGSKTLTLGDNAAQGQSTIVNNGEQKILGYADLKMIGGSGPVANGSNAIIQSNSATATQRIEANNLEMSNSTLGGNSSVAAILAARQNIHALGNVSLTANASGGTLPGVRIGGLGGGGGTPSATNLELKVGGNLELRGSTTTANNGVGIGSTGAVGAPPVANNITIDAGGNVVLTAGNFDGSGARIGTSGNTGTGAGPGEISIKAGGSIELNGTTTSAVIRTAGGVNLDAASITEGSNGQIFADTLTTKTTGATNLAGPNDVQRFNAVSGGPLTLVDAGALQVTGISTTNDAITLTTDSLTNGGLITNGGPASTTNIVLNANTFNLAGGTIEGGAAAVVLRPRTGTNSFGIESAGMTTLTNADIASIHTSDFVVLGSGMGTTFTGDMFIGRNATVDGGGKNLAFFRSGSPLASGQATTIGIGGVSTTGNLIISAGSGRIVSEGGTVFGDQLQLRASQGIGSELARVQTSANRLTLNNTGPQGAFVFEAGEVTLGNVNLTVGGIGNNVSNTIGAGGAYDVTAGGSITVSDLILAGTVRLATPAGAITEVGTGAIVASELTTLSGQSTVLGGANQLANFSASSGTDVTLNNTGALTVTGLSAGGNATLDNVGNVTITGPWTAGGTSHITAHSDIVLGSVLTSTDVVLQADGSITEFGTNGVGAVVANTLTTVSGGSTFFSGQNRVANYSGTSGADLFFFNQGDLNVTGLNASMASLSNNGAVTISGPWITAGQTNVTVFGGPGATLSETAGGFIQAAGFNSISADGSVSLNGPNRISGNLNGSSTQGDFRLTNAGDLNFGAFSSFGDVSLVNAGALNVTGLGGRNVAVSNAGPMTVSGIWNSNGTTAITTTGGNLTVNSSVTSQGLMTVDVDGALTVEASGLQVIPPPPGLPPVSFPQVASLTSRGGQDIRANSVVVSAQDGAIAMISNQGIGNQTVTASGGGIEVLSSGVTPAGTSVSSAQIANFATGSQTIRVSGGNGIDVQSNGGNAIISDGGAGLTQSILVTDADHLNVNGAGGTALISAGGAQNVSITGSGANTINLGSVGARGFSQIVGGAAQNVTAGGDGERGSITITGGAVNGPTASIVSRTSADGTQTINTSGLIRVVGGTAQAQPNSAGIFHNGSGEQKVSAARIELEGGASGNNNAALIVSSGGGVPANGGAQTVTVSGDIVIAGGAGGNAGISGPAARQQTIRAHNIEMTNSALGGNNSVGFILGGHQDILAAGNVTMTARASGGDLPGVRIGGLSANPGIGFAGTGTDLKLVVGGNLELNASTTRANNGVGIGSSAAVGTPAFDNNITIEAGSNVSLNAGAFEGSGVRIGTSTNTGTGTGGGDIRITAGGNISLNGTAQAAAIRTRGDVALEAATISEAGRGLIEANALTTRSSGDTLLGGPNTVSAFTAQSDHGNVQLNNTSAVLSLGSMDLPGNLAIVQTGDVAVGNATATEATLVAAAGDVSMSATGQILVRGSDTTIGAGSAVLAGGNLSFGAGDVTLTTGDVTLRAGDAALTPVVVRGANGVQMTVGNELNVTAGGLLSPSLLSSGGNIDLTIGHALRINGNGPFSLARVQTETRDGVISIEFPNLTQGGYFVDGVEASVHHGQTGFFTDFKAAKVGTTLVLEYGN